MTNLTKVRNHINQLLGQLHHIQSSLEETKRDLETSRNHLHHVEQAQHIFQQASQEIQKQAHQRIASVVSQCLESVFEGSDTYGLRIHFEQKRGRTEARLVLVKNGNEIDDPLNSDSGGVVDVAAFALRLSCIMMTKPRVNRVLIMDEPFKFVSAEYRENVRHLLETLSEEFHVQFILVTHIRELETGKIVRIG